MPASTRDGYVTVSRQIVDKIKKHWEKHYVTAKFSYEGRAHQLLEPIDGARWYRLRDLYRLLRRHSLPRKKGSPARFYALQPSELQVLAKVGRDAEVIRGGWPDFLVIQADGSFYFAEVKLNAGDKLRQAQVAMHAALRKVGLDVRVIWPEDQRGKS